MAKQSLSTLLVSLSLLLAASAAQAQTVTQGEDWKGPADPAEFDVGFLTGLGILDAHAGYALMGTISKKIVHQGFIPDITNSVSIETEVGPLFIEGTTAFAYSLHLRWDFQKDSLWTLYALGGLGGNITGDSLGDRFIVLPRFGVGAFYKINELIKLRGEASHELVAVGMTFTP